MASHHRDGGRRGSPAELGDEVDSDAVTDTDEHRAAGRAKDKGKAILLPVVTAAGEEEGGPSGGLGHVPDESAADEGLSRLGPDDSEATPSSRSSPQATATGPAFSDPSAILPAAVVPTPLLPAPASADLSSPSTLISLPHAMPQAEPQPPLPPLRPGPGQVAEANSDASLETRRRVRPQSPPLPLPPSTPPSPPRPPPQAQTLAPAPTSTPRPRAVSEWTPSARQEQVAVVPPMQSMLSDFSLPRWQPDAEVTYCPICRTQFSIFVRKHHCRKCGRVVCNSCSPHRITIPYQYIVHPPGQYSFRTQAAAAALLGDGSAGAGFGSFLVDVSTLGGGERVRLCNPCVPDPNTAPPQTPRLSDLASASAAQGPQTRSYHRSVSTISGASSSGNSGGNRTGNGGGRLPPSSALGPDTFLAPPPLASSSSLAPQYQQQHYHRLSLPPQSFGPGAGSESHMQFLAQQEQQAQQQRRTSRPGRHHHHHQQQQQQQQQHPRPLAEEDECPVCHLELPSRQLPNFEGLREQHIIDCLETHSGGHHGRRRTVSNSGNGNGSGSGSGTAFGPLVGASSSSGPSGGGYGYSQSQPSQLPLHQALPWRTGMFPYQATEKDCVDAAECTICLEEFEVGVPMARLECFCRFHQACIQAWFEKHPGRCPVHNHDSSDY